MREQYVQHGLSLVELLIALAISSFLILGITQVYIDNKRNQVFQASQVGNLENSRFATLIIDQYLAKAGYRRQPTALPEQTFAARSADSDCMAFAAGAPVTALATSAGKGFCLRYLPQQTGELDCQGQASSVSYTEAFPNVPSTNQIILAFKFEPNADPSKGRLMCKSLTATNPQYNEILSGIADMRLEFGVGTSAATDKRILNFKASEDWTPSDGIINGVRYQLLLTGGAKLRTGEDSAVLADWITAASATTKGRLEKGDNGHIYQVAGSTQSLRNQMP